MHSQKRTVIFPSSLSARIDKHAVQLQITGSYRVSMELISQNNVLIAWVSRRKCTSVVWLTGPDCLLIINVAAPDRRGLVFVPGRCLINVCWVDTEAAQSTVFRRKLIVRGGQVCEYLDLEIAKVLLGELWKLSREE